MQGPRTPLAVAFLVAAGGALFAQETTRVSVDSSGAEANERSSVPCISADARVVAFVCSASNLVAGDTNGAKDVFVHDRITGVTERVSVDSSGNQGSGDDPFFEALLTCLWVPERNSGLLPRPQAQELLGDSPSLRPPSASAQVEAPGGATDAEGDGAAGSQAPSTMDDKVGARFFIPPECLHSLFLAIPLRKTACRAPTNMSGDPFLTRRTSRSPRMDRSSPSRPRRPTSSQTIPTAHGTSSSTTDRPGSRNGSVSTRRVRSRTA